MFFSSCVGIRGGGDRDIQVGVVIVAPWVISYNYLGRHHLHVYKAPTFIQGPTPSLYIHIITHIWDLLIHVLSQQKLEIVHLSLEKKNNY